MDISDNQVTSSVEILAQKQEERRRLEEELVEDLNQQLEIVRQQVLTEEETLVLESQRLQDQTRLVRHKISFERSLLSRMVRNIATQKKEVLRLLKKEHNKRKQEWMECQEVLRAKRRRLDELELGDCSLKQLLAEEQRLLNVIEAEERRRGAALDF